MEIFRIILEPQGDNWEDVNFEPGRLSVWGSEGNEALVGYCGEGTVTASKPMKESGQWFIEINVGIALQNDQSLAFIGRFTRSNSANPYGVFCSMISNG